MLAFTMLQKIIDDNKPFTCTGPVISDDDDCAVVGHFGVLYSEDEKYSYMASSVNGTVIVNHMNTMKPLFYLEKDTISRSWKVKYIRDGIKSYEAISIASKIMKRLD